jgi:hypothetical protein
MIAGGLFAEVENPSALLRLDPEPGMFSPGKEEKSRPRLWHWLRLCPERLQGRARSAHQGNDPPRVLEPSANSPPVVDISGAVYRAPPVEKHSHCVVLPPDPGGMQGAKRLEKELVRLEGDILMACSSWWLQLVDGALLSNFQRVVRDGRFPVSRSHSPREFISNTSRHRWGGWPLAHFAASVKYLAIERTWQDRRHSFSLY